MRLSDRAAIPAAAALSAASALAAARLLAPSEPLPEPVRVDARDYFSEAEIAAGRRYVRPQLALLVGRAAVEVTALSWLVARRSQASPAGAAPAPQKPVQVLSSGAGAAALTAALRVLKLPLFAVSRRRSLDAGLATDSWRSWAADQVKSTAIESVLTGALTAGAAALARRWPRGWWLATAAGSVGVTAAGTMLGPVLLAPIFNNFEPLPDSQLRADILALAEAAGISVGEVYSVDASRRTTAANGYVNGLGPTKRVVLYDTLLSGYSRDEIRFAVAHELGHVAHRDVQRQLVFMAIVAPAGALGARLFSGPTVDVPRLLLSTWLVGLPIGLAGCLLSRAIERRTDDFGLALSDAPEGLISFFTRLAVQNHADVTPGWLGRHVLATHPPITERIGAALAYQRRRAA